MKKSEKNKKTAERGRQKREKDVRKLAAVYIAAVLAAAGAVGGGLFWAMESARTQKAALAESTETESAGSEEETALTEAAEKVPETESETEAQEQYVELTEDNIGNFVKVESCEIEPGSGSFVLKASAEGKPASDDDYFYLMEMDMYDTELDQERDAVASAQKDGEIVLSAGVNENSVDSWWR